MNKTFLRRLILTVGIALVLSALVPMGRRAFAFAADAVSVTLNSKNATPREVEETTQQAITREYAAAWKALATALAENRTDVLPASFVGAQREKLESQIAQQKKAGLSTRILDHGHQLDVVFYSPEGSAMQLRDTADLSIEYRDGNRAVHSENVKQHYVVLMTVAEDRWKVRLLQETD